mgnify:CR=1 FL=1
MQTFLSTLRNRAGTQQIKNAAAPAANKPLQVMVPNSVVLPLPKSPRDEICVPASINGRDMSTGRL